MKPKPHACGRGAIAFALGVALVVALAAPAAASNSARPFLGHATGTDTFGSLNGCPAEAMYRVVEDGTGQFAHLGRVDFSLTHCASVNGSGAGTTEGNGSMAIIAANGDRLALSYTATFQLEPWPAFTTADVDLAWMVTGGTGRFAAATGFGKARLTPKFYPDGSGAVSASTWWGTIAY